MTDLHALIHRMADELDHYRQLLTDNRTELHPLAAEARAALAQQEGERPTDEELGLIYHDSCRGCEFMDQGGFEDGARAILARWGRPTSPPPTDEELMELYPLTMVDPEDAFAFARAVLARWGNHPVSPDSSPQADGDVAKLAAWLRMQGDAQKPGPNSLLTTKTKKELLTNGARLTRAAELLERLSPPQPIPVSERWPGPELCWWYEPDEDDGYGGSWTLLGGSWTLLRIRGGTPTYTHWLPAHALPLPTDD